MSMYTAYCYRQLQESRLSISVQLGQTVMPLLRHNANSAAHMLGTEARTVNCPSRNEDGPVKTAAELRGLASNYGSRRIYLVISAFLL